MSVPETAAPLVLTLFGPMQVLVHGRPLPRLRSRKALWLLALLTLRSGRPVERPWLAGTLWPDADQGQAFASLRVILSELRQAMGGEADRLQSPDRHTLRLDMSGAEVDVTAFDAAISSGTLPALSRAVALYTGPLLEGCLEEWVGQERATREQDCLRALQTLGDAALATGDRETAVSYYQRAVGLDPWRDATQRGLMEALASGGDTNAALHVYREFVGLLRDDPRATPDEQMSALYERLRDEARRRSAAPNKPPTVAASVAAVPAVSGYLPHPVTDLVGREDERLEVAARLRRSRLVTLTGPGGIGKTRLAIEIASEIVQEFADGAWLVALEALSEGAQVAGQVSAVLGLKEGADRSRLQSLTDHLRDKRLLLVLDNCEHVLEASAQIAGHLLRECAGVRVLATSREALRVTGEAAWAVPSLAVPVPAHLPAGRAAMARVLMGYESAQLFVERAQGVQKIFSVTPGNAPALAQICARLEGIPLAIELAAARVRALTVEQIAARLDDHLGLLTGGSRTAQARQQTLRATLDWSYSLLSGAERLLLARLSVFSGGWSLEAAEAVCAGDGLTAGRVLDLLASLADKSLVVFEERDAEVGGRYRFLEMVRQFAAEQLGDDADSRRLRARHRDYFLALVEEGEPRLKGPEQGMWLRRLDTEIDNLRTALAWCGAEQDGAETGLQMAGALWQFWELRGYYNEGRDSLAYALGREGAEGRVNGRATALYAAGVLAFYQGDYGAARAAYEESLAIFQELGNKQGTAGSLKDLGRVAGAQGDYGTAQTLYEKSLALSRELGDLQGSGWSLNDLGNVASAQGDFRGARVFHEESLAISRELGDREGIAWSLHHVGGVAGAQGDFGAARTFHEESLSTFQELGNKQGTAWALNYLGRAVAAQGDYEMARALYEECLAIFRELGNKQGSAWSLNDLGKILGTQGDYGSARARYGESLKIFQELGDRRGVAANLSGFAALMSESAGQAARLWGTADSLRESIGAQLFLSEQEVYDQEVAQCRAALGDDAFAAAWEEGRTQRWEQAVIDVLREMKSPLLPASREKTVLTVLPVDAVGDDNGEKPHRACRGA